MGRRSPTSYFEGELGPSRSVRDEPGCRNEKLKRRLYCVARPTGEQVKAPLCSVSDCLLADATKS